MPDVACSKDMEEYFNSLFEETEHCYNIARRARARGGLDPETFVGDPPRRGPWPPGWRSF